MEIKIYLEPGTEGEYMVIVPALPGCISAGKTEAEAFNKHKRDARIISGAN